MVGPARKREAVGHLQRAPGLQGGGTAAEYPTVRDTDDEEVRLRTTLREISRLRPRAGYRMAARCLRRGGWWINDKRVQRLWREEGLKVARKGRKRSRLCTAARGSQRLRASQPNEVWSYVFVQDRTRDGRRLKLLCVVDEHTREFLAIHVVNRIRAAEVIEVLAEPIKERGAPRHLRSDNGPEFVALALRGWLECSRVQTLYITPGSPWENAYCESFNSRLRDEFLNREEFASKLEARVLSADWRRDYNEARPHLALGTRRQRNSPSAVPLRSWLRPSLRTTALHPNPNHISHSSWYRKRGLVSPTDLIKLRFDNIKPDAASMIRRVSGDSGLQTGGCPRISDRH
jgi:putative transposase